MRLFKPKKKTIDLEDVRVIIQAFTDDQVRDPIADHDALAAIVEHLMEKRDPQIAENMIAAWRRERIKERKEIYDSIFNEEEKSSR